MATENNIDYERIDTEAVAALIKIAETPFGGDEWADADSFGKAREFAEDALKSLKVKYKKVD
jgi:DnaJ-domain-containing protein 1